MTTRPVSSGEHSYFPVSPHSLLPGTRLDFDVHVRRGENLLLYIREGETFTARHQQELRAGGAEHVYIWDGRKHEYDRYIEGNLGNVLLDEGLPMAERARVFNDTSLSIVRRVFAEKLPQGLSRPVFERMLGLVREGVRHLAGADSLKAIAAIISHDYRTYSHSLHVFVYVSALLHTYGLDDTAMVQCGLGAILHDVGKTEVPAHILNKTGPLTEREWEIMRGHPRRGVELCAALPLSEQTCECILHHHEKVGGGGYPDGISGEAISLPVRIITLADIYDALTSNRSYAKACTPFEALRIMRNEMGASLDPEPFKRFIAILGNAQAL